MMRQCQSEFMSPGSLALSASDDSSVGESRRTATPGGPVGGPVAGVVVEQREVVHVVEVALRPQDLPSEVVQAVEMDVGAELAGQVADGQAAPARA